jgi:tRNA pseudouridine38-40 synthase
MLLPPKPDRGFDRALQQHGIGSTDSVLDYEFWKGHESSAREEDIARKRAWRVSQRQMEKLQEMATKFEGTHNFHNFTVGREFKDRSNQRHMKKIEVSAVRR